MEKPSAAAIGPLLLRNLIATAIIFADKSLLNLAGKHKLLEKFRALLIACFLFFLRLLPSFSLSPNFYHDPDENFRFKATKHEMKSLASGCRSDGGSGDSGIARALSQLLYTMSDVPVSSRKYELVRLLANKIIDENRRENSIALLEVNRTVLSASFSRTLGRIEAAVRRDRGDFGGPFRNGFNRIVRVAVRTVGVGSPENEAEVDGSAAPAAEKLAAELLWLAEKMVECGIGKEAVERWASASNLAWLALSAESRLQSSLLRLSAFLLKQAKDLGPEETEEEATKDQHRQTHKKMLMSWLPLLCRASNGTDSPVLTTGERAGLEKVLEEIIQALNQEEQEQVLSLWLHHFTYCSSSDWPNLHASYARWCTTSRKLMLLQ